MKDLDWVLGVKRVYLILWVLLTISTVGYVLIYGSYRGFMETLALLILICGIAPYAILKAFQWIYTGMQAKKQ